MPTINLSKVKPASVSITIGWRETGEPTPWGTKRPVMHRFTQEQLDAWWTLNEECNYTITPERWFANHR